MGRRGYAAGGLLLGGLMIGLAACGGSHHTVATTTSATPTPTPIVSTSVPPKLPTVNPLTGGSVIPTTPVVAVKIDDTENGRPQVGIDGANIVYIEEAEGGLSRLLAVFDTHLPVVEAVRSTRASDPELLWQYGPIDYVASGGGGNTLQVLDASPLKSTINDRGGPGFTRDYNRSAPYNLTADLGFIAKTIHGSAARSIGLVWSAATAQLAGDPAAPDIQTAVGSTGVEFLWNAKYGKYVRVIGGVEQHAADGNLIATPNVIFQFCKITTYYGDIDVNGNPSQYSHTVGTGEVVVFRNGKEIVGTWSRPHAGSGTTLLTKAGQPIALNPGGAWFVLVNNGTPFSR